MQIVGKQIHRLLTLLTVGGVSGILLLFALQCAKPNSLSIQQAAANGDIPALENALKNGEDINGVGKCNVIGSNGEVVSKQMNALLAATSSGQLEATKYLLDHGANPGLTNSNGNSPLFVAARFGNAAICQALIDKGADPNQQNSGGMTALLEAIYFEHPDIVSLLLKHNADPDAKADNGVTPLFFLSYTASDPKKILFRELAQVRDGSSDEYIRNSQRHEGIRQSLIGTLCAAGADPNLRSFLGTVPLSGAAQIGNIPAMRSLLKMGANINAKSQMIGTPLDYAAVSGQKEAAMFLLSRGAKASHRETQAILDKWRSQE